MTTSSGQSLTGGASGELAPELADIGKRWKEMGIPDLYEGCLDTPHGGEICRERGRNVRSFFYPKPSLPTGRMEDFHIDGNEFGVDVQIPVRIIWPHESVLAKLPGGKPSSTLVFFHGGAWVVGDIDSHEAHCIRHANEAECVVVTVDYRLAPEHPFPAAYNDCWIATQWAYQNIEKLGGNAKRFAVGGDSAGGNLAAAVAVACRDASIALAAQLLVYPATNLGQLKGTPEIAYLGEDHAVRCRDWRASPYHAPSHAGLAPAILGVGIHDFLYKDNVAYLEILKKANVAVTYREFATLNHGFFSYPAISKDSLAAAQILCADLRAHFAKADNAAA